MKADNLSVKQIHIRVEIQLMYDGLSIFALRPILELTRIRCDLLMWDGGFESAVQEIVCNIADRSPVGTVSTAFTRKGMHLKSKLLHNPLRRLTVDLMPKIAQLCP